MPRRPKTLVIVEGVRTDATLVECLAKACGMAVDVYGVAGNIYLIYKEMQRAGFDANVKDIAAELAKDRRDREILRNDFADTFLVFDCDAQHTDGPHEKDMPMADRIARNMARIAEMAPYFDDSTDPTKGKLFVNYPMVESFRDCDDFFDSAYEHTAVPIAEIGGYKQRVAGRKLCRRHLKDYTRAQFESLCRMNVFKLSALAGSGFRGMDYPRFLDSSSCLAVARAESQAMSQTGTMPVLNTSLFLPLDYFGNKNGYYDRVVNGILSESGP